MIARTLWGSVISRRPTVEDEAEPAAKIRADATENDTIAPIPMWRLPTDHCFVNNATTSCPDCWTTRDPEQHDPVPAANPEGILA
jgi:hypothetical protein